MEAHHFCRQVNQDFAQCALFDGNTEGANLNGIEYIISEKLFETLRQEERKFWHPHNYEILSGQLVAPAISEVASKELMRGKINSYGKTFHLWSTERGQTADGGADARVVVNRDGEAKQGLVERRDQAMGINTAEIRERRQELAGLTRPLLQWCGLKALVVCCCSWSAQSTGVWLVATNGRRGRGPFGASSCKLRTFGGPAAASIPCTSCGPGRSGWAYVDGEVRRSRRRIRCTRRLVPDAATSGRSSRTPYRRGGRCG